MGWVKPETEVNLLLLLLWGFNKILYKTQDWETNEDEWEKGKTAEGNWIR